MGKGRKALPDEMKLLRGTAKKSRMQKAGTGGNFEIVTKVPTSGLKGVAKKIYEDAAGQLVACGVLDVVGLPMLVSYAREMGLYYTLMQEMEKAKPEDNNGFVIEEFTKFGSTMKVNPKRKIAQNALVNAKSLASEFGFTPASRSKIAAMLSGVSKNTEDEFSEFEEL